MTMNATDVREVTNCFLIAFKVHSKEVDTYLVTINLAKGPRLESSQALGVNLLLLLCHMGRV